MAFLFLRQRGKINNLYVIASARKESSAEKAYKLIGSGPISSNIVYKNKQFDNVVQIYNINEEKLTEFSKQKGINIMEKPLNSYNSTNILNLITSQGENNKIDVLDSIKENLFDAIDIINSETKSYGALHLLSHISENIGLTATLRDIFGDLHKVILAKSQHLFLEQGPDMYCEWWASQNDITFSPKLLSSQRISELYKIITDNDIDKFYEIWTNRIYEQEFLALDITSISTYSEQIEAAEYGYNRDDEKLKQLNVCLLFGEQSGLPAYSELYPGSITDVRTFITTVEQFTSLSSFQYKIVTDKGFYSAGNLDYLIKRKIDFLQAVPFTNNIARNLIKNNLDLENDHNHIIQVNQDMLYYRTVPYYRGQTELYAHLFLNIKRKYNERFVKIERVKMLEDIARKDFTQVPNNKEFKKYFNINKVNDGDEENNLLIKDNILDSTFTSGWILLISNCISDAETAITIYRNKNVVEEAYNRMKNILNINRTLVHSDKSFKSKYFIIFIAIIFASYVHKIMKNNDLYKHYTMNELLKQLTTIKKTFIRGKVIFHPLTKKQKEIFSAFKCSIPGAGVDPSSGKFPL